MEERQETQSRMKKHKEARLTEKGPCAVWPRMNIITVKSRYWTPKGKQEDSGKVLLVQWRPSGQRNAEYISFFVDKISESFAHSDISSLQKTLLPSC